MPLFLTLLEFKFNGRKDATAPPAPQASLGFRNDRKLCSTVLDVLPPPDNALPEICELVSPMTFRLWLSLALLLVALGLNGALVRGDADFESVRVRMTKDSSGKGGDPKEKYWRLSIPYESV
ncbi:MAG: hypothetical protein Q9167_000185 [Letrouitia subvulpina]